MRKITILSKTSCGPCVALKGYIKTLPEELSNKISIIDDTTVSVQELYAEMDKRESNAFPTIVLEEEGSTDRLIHGFGEKTKSIIKDFLLNA